MIDQLIKKDCNTGEYGNIHPNTVLAAVEDPSTGKTLDEILGMFNHLYLPFKNFSIRETRLQVPNKFRKRGLWITYLNGLDTLETEFYVGDSFDNDSWTDDNNWNSYIDKDELKKLLLDQITWFKA